MGRHRKGVLFLSMGVLLLFLWNRQPFQHALPIYHSPPEISAAVSKYASCLLTQFSHLSPNELWSSLGSSVEHCQSDFWKKIVVDEYPNIEEKKWHVRVSSGQECVVSIGIGRDIRAERLLIKDSSIPPVMFGADPIYEGNDALYSSIGTFFPFAVGDHTGIFDCNVLSNGSYFSSPVIQLSLPAFLRGFVPRSTIDVLWMDAEGGEYGMMEMLHKDGALDREGLTLCQIFMEVHKPDPERELMLEEFLHRLLKEHKYVLLRVNGAIDLRLFLLNVSSEDCLRRFVFQFLS